MNKKYKGKKNKNNGVVKEEKKGVPGVVIEALPDTLFKVLLEDKTEKLAFLGGKMKMHRIRVLVGDKVLMEIDPYGGKARIFKRV
ncbi:MAG: translation initiation factor IF-1 [Candidatus Paceibacterota bacterium]